MSIDRVSYVTPRVEATIERVHYNSYDIYGVLLNSLKYDPTKTLEDYNITVLDAVMGSGKTTYVIDEINKIYKNSIKNISSDAIYNYIYITPYLNECERIQEACSNANFIQPIQKGKGKLNDLEQLVEDEKNIVSTHALLSLFTKETLDLLKNKNYRLILDEAIEPIANYELSKTDIDTLFKADLVEVADDGITLKWIGDKLEKSSRFYKEYKLIENENLVVFQFSTEKKVFLWEMTPNLFSSFVDTTILTYRFNSSILRSYFDAKSIKYTHDTSTLDRGLKYGHLIDIYEGPMNELGDHKQALASSLKNDKKKQITLKKHMENYVQHIAKAKSSDVLWTTFLDVKNGIKGKGYTKGFLSHTVKATNEYKDRTTVMYVLNKFMNVPVKRYIEDNNIDPCEDEYALQDMLQWIFRSAIREHKEIKIYIPSKRMRELLQEWCKNN